MRQNARRPGFTLVELLVVMVVGGLMMMAVYQVLIRQQRSYTEQQKMIVSQQATRTALDVLAGELREMSATGGDLVDASAHSVTFRAYRNFGIVCDPGSLGVPYEIIMLGEPFTGGTDSAMVFFDHDPAKTNDDVWRSTIVGDVSTGTCTLAGRTSHSVKLSDLGGISGVYTGAPVRSFERIIYSLAQIDGEWVLARQGRDNVRPVAPLGPLADPEVADGLRFRYFDESGTEFTPADATGRARVRRIGIEVRVSVGGDDVTDSLFTQVQLRGNAWQ